MHVGTLIPHFKKGDFGKLDIPVPDRDEQEFIGDTYFELSEKIEQNRRTGRKLERLARAVFKAWFVDFEPVKAKAAGATAFPGMPAETFAALHNAFQSSPLGPMPEKWDIGTLGDAVHLCKQQVQPQDHADELFDHFSIPAFDAGQNAIVELGSGIKSQKSVVVPGCVLLSKLNPRIARVWLPPAPNGRRQIASTEFLVAVPRPGWAREYLFCLFLQGQFRDSLAQSASGTSNSHQRVRPGDLLTRPLVVAPAFMREAFADQIIPQMQLRAALHAESAKLAALRDYLLPRLLSGRVRVGEVVKA
jgi:type I restriction enzyme S subunit